MSSEMLRAVVKPQSLWPPRAEVGRGSAPSTPQRCSSIYTPLKHFEEEEHGLCPGDLTL